jgi:hypothetical protein
VNLLMTVVAAEILLKIMKIPSVVLSDIPVAVSAREESCLIHAPGMPSQVLDSGMAADATVIAVNGTGKKNPELVIIVAIDAVLSRAGCSRSRDHQNRKDHEDQAVHFPFPFCLWRKFSHLAIPPNSLLTSRNPFLTR